MKSLILFLFQIIGAMINPLVALAFLILGLYGGYQLRPTIEPVIKQVEQVQQFQQFIQGGNDGK